jgi:RNA polymerase sigma-70 factor (ECF subfamily)
MSSESDRLLIQQIRRGDPQAWTQLISRYEGRLLAFAERRLRDRATSEDVVQETFIGFLNSLPNFDDRRELQTYLFTIAAHKITDVLRRRGRQPVQSGSDAGGEDLLGQQLDAAQLAASSLVRYEEQRLLESAAIARALRQLIGHWRERGDYGRIQVLELLMVKGWANRDVAKFLLISEQQVANYRFAAVRKLAEHVRGAGLPADVFPELHRAERDE